METLSTTSAPNEICMLTSKNAMRNILVPNQKLISHFRFHSLLQRVHGKGRVSGGGHGGGVPVDTDGIIILTSNFSSHQSCFVPISCAKTNCPYAPRPEGEIFRNWVCACSARDYGASMFHYTVNAACASRTVHSRTPSVLVV